MKHLNLLYAIYLSNYDISFVKSSKDILEDYDLVAEKYEKSSSYKSIGKEKALQLAKLALDKSRYFGINLISWDDENYPESLKSIADCPPLLFYKGSLPKNEQVAIVGSRNTSKYAKKITDSVVDWITEETDWGIVSGLAYGIDEYAHRAALRNENYTLAVLPMSLDQVYPKDHYGLAVEIVEKGGCLISELPIGINRGKKAFVQRNRIQAALSDIVIPIEMGLNSGTTHTINFSKRYNKSVFVMRPTPMLESLESYSGINNLIKTNYEKLRVFSDKESFVKLLKPSEEWRLDL